ncbi:MAG: Lactate/malate dehydrogenase [Nitrosopumilales archaeon]|nr:MAG: Lactate/malate dehydrogenase [Nitrosopumilales archaeon]
MISIIGSGRVGSAIAFLAAATSLDDIHLVNRHKDKALGQALDISNTIPEDSPISVVGTDFSEIKNSEVIVISASAGTYLKSRTDMLSKQVTMIRDIAKEIKKFAPDSKILVVSNPVDILNYIFQKETGFPRECVIGVSSSLDSSRFRYLLAKEFQTKQSEIKNAMVLGEHDDSMVPIFSIAKLNSKPVLELLNNSQVDKITRELRDYWKVLRKFKGPSIFGIAKNTVDVIKSIIKNEVLSIPASVMLDGEYGLSDVCLGVPIRIGKDGMMNIQEIDLQKSELESLKQSADVIRKYLYQQQTAS